MKSSVFNPGSGLSVELMRQGVSCDDIDELEGWVRLLARVTGKSQSRAFIDEYYGIFARKGNPKDRLNLVNVAMDYAENTPEKIICYPVFENFIKKLAEDGAIENSDQNVYFADYDADDMIMTLAQHVWGQADAIFKGRDGEKWRGENAFIMCVNSAASLYLDRLYDLKRDYIDRYSKNPAELDKLKTDVLSLKFSRDRRLAKVKNEEKYTPFIRDIVRINYEVQTEIAKNFNAISAGYREQLKNFGSRSGLPNERSQAIGKSWEFVSSCYQSLTSAAAIKDMGYDTFNMKADEIARKISEKAGDFCPKKAQLVIKLASGKTNDPDYRWLDRISLTSKDPFEFNIQPADEINQKIFALACSTAKAHVDPSYLCERIGEQIRNDPNLSMLDIKDSRNLTCAHAVFFALGKSMSSEITPDEQKEGEEAWARIKQQGGGRQGSFMRR